jgi:hypothetical protein
MEASHAICARIQISYPDGRIKNPAWNNEQVNKLTKQSPLFERQLLRLMQDEQHVWKIELKETDDFYDVDLDPFIVNLGRPQGRNSSNGMEVNSLSRRCSAMWYFEVVPSKVHLASYATGNDGETIASNSPTPITSSTPTLVSGNSASRAPTVSESSSSESESWCWHHNDDHKSPETSLKLANIALVLDWREVFRREIKTVVWNWRPRETLADPKTPVDCLRRDGVKGLNSKLPKKLVWGCSES